MKSRRGKLAHSIKRETPDAELKRTSVLRRIASPEHIRLSAVAGLEGDVCAFKLAPEAPPIAVEGVTGRRLMLASGDIFLTTPGYRESTRWVVGGIPDGGLVPDNDYWVLSESGVVGDLFGDSPREKTHLGQVKYLGVVTDEENRALNIRQYGIPRARGAADHKAAVFLVLGTSAEIGKTTAGIAVLRALRLKGRRKIIALKATGTSSFAELTSYLDFGAAQAFDCVDFGLPTTYPSERNDIDTVFAHALDTCLSTAADAVIMECGGDILGANVPVFLRCLVRRRERIKVILAAGDALGALGGKRVLEEIGMSPNLITGPCTDTPTLRQRTQALCGIPAMNLSNDALDGALL